MQLLAEKILEASYTWSKTSKVLGIRIFFYKLLLLRLPCFCVNLSVTSSLIYTDNILPKDVYLKLFNRLLEMFLKIIQIGRNSDLGEISTIKKLLKTFEVNVSII